MDEPVSDLKPTPGRAAQVIRQHVKTFGWELLGEPKPGKGDEWTAVVRTGSSILGMVFTLCADGTCVTSRPRRTMEELEALLAQREATLDAISYRCANYAAKCLYRAGVEIDKIITESGYKVKDRSEGAFDRK